MRISQDSGVSVERQGISRPSIIQLGEIIYRIGLMYSVTSKLRICVNSQTPLVRFMATTEEIEERFGKAPGAIALSSMHEGSDYELTPGGVTRMILPLLKKMMARGEISEPFWVSLNPSSPEKAVLDGITLVNIHMDPDMMKGYGSVKEAIWKEVHGIPRTPLSVASLVWSDEFTDFNQYNRLCTETIHKLDKENDFDVFYIHDFQQLPAGIMLDTLKPKIFRWHIPLDEGTLTQEWRGFLSRYMSRYDAVIVSSKRYLATLRKFGYTGCARHIYPYIDPEVYGVPSRKQMDEFCSRCRLADSDKVILVVARMDPMKGQDKAIEALSIVQRKVPDAKLILAGNGSFSSSKRGLNLSKGSMWSAELGRLARDLKVEDRVVFTGHLTHGELEAAYSRCDLTLLPSLKEGFGLVVIESWLYRKPTVVSSHAGIAELISNGENGILVNPVSPHAMASSLSGLLSDSERRANLGERGFEGSRKCLLNEGLRMESLLLREVTEGTA